MTLDLRQWTTPEEVRALLGIQPADISDASLLLPIYSVGLEADIRDINIRILAEFDRILGIPYKSGDQDWFLAVAKSFAVHSVARQVLTALPLAALRDMGDGKSLDARFAGDPYKETAQRLEAAYAVAKARLVPALQTVTPSVSSTLGLTQSYMAVSSPSYDPVTGEG